MNKSFKIKAVKLLALLIIGIFIAVACSKPDEIDSCDDGIKNQEEVEIDCGGTCKPCEIKYVENGVYGPNILYGTAKDTFPATGSSFSATVPIGSSLKVEMYLVSGPVWYVQVGSNVGWTTSVYNLDMQTFTMLNPGVSDYRFVNTNLATPGVYIIKYFENSTTETKSKTVVLK